MAFRTAMISTFACAVGVAGFGCSRGEDDVIGTATTTTDGSVGLDGSLPRDDGGFIVDGALDTPLPPGLGCSADLQDVTDKDGNVVVHCAPDRGCYGGTCIDPCEAAAKSHGSIGCDFLVPTPSFGGTSQPCLAVVVANQWPKPAKVTVDRAGSTFDATTFGVIAGAGVDATKWAPLDVTGVPADQVGILFLSHDPTSAFAFTQSNPDGGTTTVNFPQTCPIPPAIASATMFGPPDGWFTALDNSETGRGSAFHVHTSVPVLLYDIYPYGGATSFEPSAELILPTSGWGTNYVLAMVPYGPAAYGFQYFQVVAQADDTHVQLLPNENLHVSKDGTVDAAPKGVVTTYSLKAGETIQFETNIDDDPSGVTPLPNEEISGSVLQSDRPVGVFIGHSNQNMKTSTSVTDVYAGVGTQYGGAADTAHQELAPVSALGFDYAIAPYATRRKDLMEEAILYRLVGTVDGTTLKFDPPVAGAPSSIDFGKYVDFEATGAFRVTSQDEKHPFFVGQQMSGAWVTSHSRPGITPGQSWYDVLNPPPSMYTDWSLGDPDFVVQFPPAQFLHKYVFFTDPTYGTTTLSIVRTETSTGFSDVSVDCAGTLTGWKPVDAAGQYEWTTVDLWRAAAPGIGSCTNGRHVATSKGPFGITVWGTDYFASYGYPAGGNVGTINSVVVSVIR